MTLQVITGVVPYETEQFSSAWKITEFVVSGQVLKNLISLSYASAITYSRGCARRVVETYS